MSWWGEAREAARLLCAAAIAVAWTAPAWAQSVPSADLDPSAPLDALPDLGVEWPDMDTDDSAATAAPAPAATVTALSDSAAERPYTLALEGLEQLGSATQLVEAFNSQSALQADDSGDANAAQIDRRSRADAELLTELLRSHGYYDAVVEPRIEASAGAVRIVLESRPGERYHFTSVELPGLQNAGDEAEALRRTFAVTKGDPVIAQEVIAGGIALKVALGEQGFALASVGEQDIEIDPETKTAQLVLPVDPGPQATFGTIRVSGRPRFSSEHVARIARFEPGEPFRRSRVDDLRRALIATGLVASADVRVVPAADGKVDLAVQLAPAPRRTLAGEFGYGTGEGVRAEASWQHRNLFNPEGALTLRGVAGTQEQLAAIQFRRNNLGTRDQVLNLQALASHTDRNAYEAKTLLIGGNIERQSNIIWHKKWTWSVGADLIATDERGVFNTSSVKDNRTFLIAALPASLGYDASNDLLNPTRGFRLLGRLSPELSARGGEVTYAKAQLDGSIYRPVSDSIVLAVRVRGARIFGADAMAIAPSRRLYAGGGGSVRGYGYQKLGPRDLEGDPIGGQSLAEFALESRFRLTLFGGNFGIVPFLDGGTLTNKAWPELDEWQFGAGVGLRYYSSFGPIRVDVGTPLNPRTGDSPIAVTVSLGQAF
jgi:translocation and assembly module TamA